MVITLATFSQNVNDLKLKEYHPVSIYEVPQTEIKKAKFPVIDVHTHDYAKTDADLMTG
jgi:hypothetical protein